MTSHRPAPLAPLLLALLAGACSTTPMKYGPPDLDTTSQAAPRCKGQTYPFHSLENLETGQVLVAAQVAADGTVDDTRLLAKSKSGFLDAASLTAVRTCRFTAGAPRQVNVTVVWDLIGGYELPTGVVTIGVQPSRQPR